MKKLLYAIAMVSCLYLHSTDIQNSGEAASADTSPLVLLRGITQGGIDHKKEIIFSGNINKCSFCNFEHRYLTKVETHIQDCHPEATVIQKNIQYECSICHKTFTRLNNATKHYERAHAPQQENSTKKVQCFCGEKYSSNHALTKHIKKHHPEQSKAPIPLPDPLNAEFDATTIQYPVISQPAPPPADLDANI